MQRQNATGLRKYIQHSAHIPPGREGLFDLIKNAPATLRYENQLILANGDFLMLHGRFSGLGPGIPNWIVVDIVRLESAHRETGAYVMWADAPYAHVHVMGHEERKSSMKAIQIDVFGSPAEVVKAVDAPDVGAPAADEEVYPKLKDALSPDVWEYPTK